MPSDDLMEQLRDPFWDAEASGIPEVNRQRRAAADEIIRLRAELAEAKQHGADLEMLVEGWRLAAEQAEAALAEVKRECERLEKLVYVPGLLKCAKCGCSVISTNLHYPSGGFSADSSPKECPNGCGPMWPVTERAAGNEMVDRCEAQCAELAETKRELVAAQEVSNVLYKAREQAEAELAEAKDWQLDRTWVQAAAKAMDREGVGISAQHFKEYVDKISAARDRFAAVIAWQNGLLGYEPSHKVFEGWEREALAHHRAKEEKEQQ